MPLSIGIITASQSLNSIRSAEQEMRKHAKITYLSYHTLSELCDLYSKNFHRFDGFLFSGPFPRDYILENIGAITKPYRCFDLKDRDYYLTFARILARHPGIDFSRVFFDAEIELAILRNVFPEGKGPRMTMNYTPLEYRGFLCTAVYERALDTYRELWYQKKCDIFVIRFTNLAEQLEREGIPHFSLRPCKESILDDFHALIGDIRESILQNSLVACCIIEIPEASRTLENEELLESALDVFGRSQNCNILARKNREHFEVITSNMEARKITDEYKTCMLSSELNQKLPFPIRIGWGISFDVIDAYKNAKKAVLACQKNRNHYTYLVTESQEMVGPLNSNRSISYGLQPDAQVSFLAKSLGISPVNLEKLVSLQKTRYMYEFTSSDLVYFLEITPRSAARILSKLEKGGLARPIRSVNLSGTGRPTIVYEVDFHTLSD